MRKSASKSVRRRAPISVVVVDDHEMILQSVVKLLAADPDIVVVGTAVTGAQGVEITIQLKPDVLVIDYHLSDMDAPEAISRLREAHSESKVVTMSGSERQGAMYASMRVGSSAWVSKTRAIHELRDAIRRVAAGQSYFNVEMDDSPRLDQLILHYQPIIAFASGRIVGFEALVRWQHPERGLLLPASFLPHAEVTGFIGEIDLLVREEAIRQLARWQEEYPSDPPLWMSVNCSATDLVDTDLSESIAKLLEDSRIDPSHLIVEITESVLLDDSDATLSLLTRLKAIGVRLALDDFGTAFSSISYLRRFPFDHLKVDISFTAELLNSARSSLLVSEIWRMAESMKMKSVVEGIERVEQLIALRDIGFEYGQGYLFSHAVSAVDCETLLAGPSLIPSLEVST